MIEGFKHFVRKFKKSTENVDQFVESAAERMIQLDNTQLNLLTSASEQRTNLALAVQDPLDSTFYQIRRVRLTKVDPITAQVTSQPNGVVVVSLFPLGFIGQRRIPESEIQKTLKLLDKTEEAAAKRERIARENGEILDQSLLPGAVGIASYTTTEQCKTPNIDQIAEFAGEKYAKLIFTQRIDENK